MLPIEHLLPLRALDITLQFTDTTHIRLFHQPALTAWLRHLMGDVPGYEQYLTLDAPESGRVDYQARDYYRFSLITLAGGEHLLQLLLDRLVELPHSVTRRDIPMPFRDNLIFHSAYDVFQSHPIQRVDELTPYTLTALQQEAEYWQPQEYFGLRWLAPVRLLLPSQPQKNRKGEMRFCRHRSQLDFALLNNRLYDSLAELLRQRVSEVPPRQTDETSRWQAADLFWIDYTYRDGQGKEKPMGGLLGRLIFATTAMSTEQRQYWVLGQYLGIGQRRIFGWGRYQLETTAGESTMVRSSAASSLDVGGEQAPTLMSSKAPNQTTSMATKSSPPKVIRVGEMEASGTVVFVSGTPSIVTTLEEQLRLLPVATEESDHAPEPLLNLPWRQVQAVVLLGAQHHITTPALRTALQHGVAVHFADSGGHYQGCTWSGVTEDQQLWLAQVSWFSHPDNVLPAARSLVVARLRHQREVLRQRNLQHRFDESLKRLERLANQSSHAIDLASLRGFEGQGAKCYFEALSTLLPSWVDFTGRHRRPPPDPFNDLLSLGYTILSAHVETVIRVGGLLPWIGLYHQPHGHHAVLVSDLLEPFRHLVERVALNAVSKKQLTAEDFVMTANQGCRLHDQARRHYLTLLSERFETPFRGQQLETAEKLHRHLHWQVQMVKLWIRGQQAQFSAWRMH